MSDPSKALEALTQWQNETRQQIVDEIGEAIMDALRKIGFRAGLSKVVQQPNGRRPRMRRTRRRLRSFRTDSVVGRVYQLIKKHPGNRGFQIVALAVQSGQQLNERTMRTALRRLKVGGFIEQRDGAWHPTEEAEKVRTG